MSIDGYEVRTLELRLVSGETKTENEHPVMGNTCLEDMNQ